MLANLLFVVAAQATAPVLPAGVRPEFQRQVLQIEASLEKGDFAGAKAQLDRMPTSRIAVSWNDTLVPVEKRTEFSNARQAAFDSWTKFAPNLSFSTVDQGPAKFVLANGQSAVRATEGGIVSVVGLTRGERSLDANNLHNEVARAIGLYLGVNDSPLPGSAMFPSEAFAPTRLMVTPQDAEIAARNIAALDVLRKAAAEGQRLKPASSSMTVMTPKIDLGKMLQGEKKDFSIQVENKGTNPLEIWVRPDCGCMTSQSTFTVAPGTRGSIPVKFDSKPFPAPVAKHIILVSNDPERPTQVVDMNAELRPLYRFLAPKGNVAVMDDKGGVLEVFLTFTEREPFKVRQVDFTGIKGEVEYEAWEGKMADPELGTEAVSRKGYKFTINLAPNQLPGRSPGTLVLMTDAPESPTAMFTVYAQKGIVAIPDELYLGNITGPRMSKLVISRPGTPFKATGTRASSPHLKASIAEGATPDEFVLQVEFDGKAPKGPFEAIVEVLTNDAKQPIVRVPVFGTVR